jgi:hypothetical protein
MEVFLVQLLVAALGAASIAIADWSYHGGRVRQRVHSFWVAGSIVAICLPVLDWTCDVFLGSGLLGRLLTSGLAAAIFLWVYRKSSKSSSGGEFGQAAAPTPLERCCPSSFQDQRLNPSRGRPFISLRRHARPLTSSAFLDERWSCSRRPAPPRGWGIRRPSRHAVGRRQRTLVCRFSDRPLSV